MAAVTMRSRPPNYPTCACLIPALLLWLSVFPGCDAVYRLVQREGAEEKELLGEVVPLERNSRVEEVQRLLKLYGYRIGRADGLLGANTRKAIEDFQRDNGLKVSRFVDKATWERLTEFERCGLVRGGELNTAAVQQALRDAGFESGPIDGKMGKRTVLALQGFQREHGLKPDGKIGIRTLNKLKEYVSAAGR